MIGFEKRNMMSRKQLKVLHIMSGFGGGISSFIRNKAEYMTNEGIQFDVVTYDECSEEFERAIHAIGGTIYKLKNPKTTSWKEFKESFISVLEKNVYDIIHCHINGYRILPYYYYANKYSKADFYVHAHSSHYPEKMLSKTMQLKIRIDQMINRKITDKVVGCGTLSIINIFGEKVKEEDIVVIPNSVEVERFIKSEIKSEQLKKANRLKLQIKDDQLVIGHIGRLEAVKNHELTLELAEKIKQLNLNMKILIIGEGNREQELKNLVTQKGLGDTVIFTGRVSPIEDFFPVLDVMLLPSFAEGLPTVVVEAQASGVPVVMSDTITKEVDLGFDMLESVSIGADISEWVKAIEKTQNIEIPNAQTREMVIKEKNFSNENSAQLYAKFLRGEVTHYTII